MSVKNWLIRMILLFVVGGTGYLAYRKLVLPSLVAFKEGEAARSYRDSHGGGLLSYAQALESVKTKWAPVEILLSGTDMGIAPRT